MFGSIIRGVGSAAAAGIDAVGDVVESSTGILASLVDGERPNTKDVITLSTSGWTVAEIATFYGVANHIIQHMMESEDA